MDIAVYTVDCNGDPILFEHDYIRNIVAHELGHILGLEHHSDKDHLMWGDDEFVQEPFKTLGFIIPEQLKEYLVGERELSERLDYLGGMLDKLDKDIDRHVDRFGDVHGNTIYFETEGQVSKYNKLVRTFNIHVDEYNSIISELDCMYYTAGLADKN